LSATASTPVGGTTPRPAGIALDSSNFILLTDYANSLVDVFAQNAAGQLVQVGTIALPSGSQPLSLLDAAGSTVTFQEAVPEPSALVLCVVGGAGLLALARRGGGRAARGERGRT
jgi:hypothetical protein